MEIYDAPANMFVAGFIGAPPMNFLDASHRAGGIFEIDGMENSIKLPVRCDQAEGRKVVLDIRPEEFSILRGDGVGPRGPTFDVVPEIIESMGADTLVTFTIGSRELQARVGGKEKLHVGEPLRVSCPAKAVHLFDSEGGRAGDAFLPRRPGGGPDDHRRLFRVHLPARGPADTRGRTASASRRWA